MNYFFTSRLDVRLKCLKRRLLENHTTLNCSSSCWMHGVIFIRFMVDKSYSHYTEKFTESPTVSICCKEESRRGKTLSSHRATVTDDVSKLGYTGVIFVDLGVKVDETYCCNLLLSQQFLPAIRYVSPEFIFQKNSAPSYRARYVFRH